MKTPTQTRKAPRRLSGVNPYVRPRSCRSVRALELPALEEHLGEATPALVFETGAQISWDNIAVWRLAYRCRYADGHLDRRLHVRSLIAATRTKALDGLRRLHVGFGVAKILLYEVRGPLTLAEIAEIKRLNEEKSWLDTD